MTEVSFYNELLRLGENWKISDVRLDMEVSEVHIYISYCKKTGNCPFSGEESRVYDYAPERIWRHLDTMQYKTWLHCRIPRVINAEGKVSTIEVPWADYSERYTHLFSSAVIQLLQFTKNQSKTAQFFATSFDVVNSIMNKAVERGMENRKEEHYEIEAIGIDEKSFQKGHRYSTIVTDSSNKRVLEVVESRTKEAATLALNKSLSEEQKEKVRVVTTDMWDAFQSAAGEQLPQAEYVLDRFHLVKYLNKAIDNTRRKEVKDNPLLRRARFLLLKNNRDLNEQQRARFEIINKENSLTAQVWKARENFKAMFGQPDKAHAISILFKWINDLRTTTLKYLAEVRDMFNRHFAGVANALYYPHSNSIAERINGGIQELKTIGRGFRKHKNFRTAILFHYGKLNLFPPQKFR